MKETIRYGMEDLRRKMNNKRLLKRIIALLSVVTVLITTNSLTMVADTLERIPACGFEEHEHTETCYDETGAVICGLEYHVHTDACYQQRPGAEESYAEPIVMEYADTALYDADPASVDLEPPVEELGEFALGEDVSAEPEESLNFEAAEAFVEIIPVFDLDGASRVALSVVLSEVYPDLDPAQVIEIGESIHDEAQPLSISVEQAEGDFTITALRDFIDDDTVEMSVRTADDRLYLVELKNGIEYEPAEAAESTPEPDEESAEAEAVPEVDETSDDEPVELELDVEAEQSEDEAEAEEVTEAGVAEETDEVEAVEIDDLEVEETEADEPAKADEAEAEEPAEDLDEAEAEDGLEEAVPEIEETDGRTVRTANIDVAAFDVPFSLNGLMIQAGAEEIDTEAEPAEAAEVTDIDYDEGLFLIEQVGNDHLITPLADFEAATITVEAGDIYVLNLTNYAKVSTEEDVAYPAQEFEASVEGVSVYVAAEEGTFPAGTTMSAAPVYDEAKLDDIASSVEEEGIEVRRVHAVDITFRDADGIEIEPLLPVFVVMNAETEKQGQDAVVVHMDDEGNIERMGQVEIMTGLELESEAMAAFNADAFSIYAMVVTQRYISASGQAWDIQVSYDSEAGIPEGATLAVREISGEEYEDLLNQAADKLSDRSISDAHFFDISIMDGDAELQPLTPVEVKITMAQGDGDVSAVHFGDTVEVIEEVRQDGKTLSFDAQSFSVYGIIYTVEYATTDKEIDVTVDFREIVINGVDFDKKTVLSALNDGVAVNIDELEKGYGGNESAVQEFVAYSTADNEVIETLNGWAAMQVASYSDGLSVVNGQIRVTADGKVVLTDGETTIVITVKNYTRLLAENVAGEGVTIDVLEGEVPAGSVATYIENDESTTVALIEAYKIIEETDVVGSFDVSIAMPEGDEYKGEGQFKVTVDAPEVPEGGKLNLFHIHDGKATQINAEIVDGKMTFVTSSFSDFVYTVDFEYSVNGEVYEYSLSGGEKIALSELVEVLGIYRGTKNTENDTETQAFDSAEAFMKEVADVEFSDERLVKVTRVEDDRVEDDAFSDDESGTPIYLENDWILESLQPFDTEEKLTITMKNGDVVTVKVTDAQIKTYYLSDSGELYEVTVTYGDDAQIPDGATLAVTPYEDDSEEYAMIRNTVFWQADEDDQAGKMQALDITIVDSDGSEIEPAAPVKIELVVKNVAEDLETSEDALSILHLNTSSGDVLVETVADMKGIGNIHVEDEQATAAFMLESFSQFAITYGTYVKVSVHYVDVNGEELAGSTTAVRAYNSIEYTLGNYSKNMTRSGYTYLGAHYATYSGRAITSLKATTAGNDSESLNSSGYSVIFYNNSEIVARQEYESSLREVDVYLVYAPSSGYYIADTISKDGCLKVQNGTSVIQTGTDQNLFVKWYRSSNNTDYQEVTQSKIINGTYNIPELDGPAVNVAIDEGANQYYKAVIYKVENNEEVVLAETDPYHVPYFDDVRNGGFETPQNDGTVDNDSAHKWKSNYQVKNGADGVIWKTTGTIADGRDIEIPNGANANGPIPNYIGETLRNYAFAFMPEGTQCAELNCEAAGALYQDVLTIPGSQLYWSLYHRARGAYDTWKTRTDKTQNKETDTMYVVAMSTELAEKYDVTTQAKVLEILSHVNDPNSEFYDVEIVKLTTTNQGDGTMTFMNSGYSLTVPPTYFGNLTRNATVYDSGTRLTFTYGNTDWHYYTGNFSIPDDQYLTRFFFVAGDVASGNPTMGNFIDDIHLSDSVPAPNYGQATAIIQKTVTGLNTLPENYATRIEATYKVTENNGTWQTVDKNSDYDLYRTEIASDGSAVSSASWTFPISIGNGQTIGFTKAEEKAPNDTTKTDAVEGYTQTTSYVISKQTGGQTTVIAQGQGKEIPSDEITKLGVSSGDIVYIEFINHYTPKQKVSIWKTDPDGHVISTGASFALYKAEDYDDAAKRPKDDAETITSGTTGDDGILYLGELENGAYRLVETKAPDGYNLLDSAVQISITNGTVSALVGTSNLSVVSKGDSQWVAGQDDGTQQIRVWNNPGYVLPSTGGPGTRLFTILGSMLVMLAGAGFILLQRKKRVA